MENSARAKTSIYCVVIVLALFFAFAFLTPQCFSRQEIYLRVLVLKDKQSVNIEIKGSFIVQKHRDSQDVLYKGKKLNAALLVYKETIRLGGVDLKADDIFIKPLEGDIVKIDGREFKGGTRIIKNKDKQDFLVINFIELEEYVKGVLYHEISHHWPMEAIKAQALASRTFALYQQGVNQSKDYDLTSDIYSQVYGGKTSERYRTNVAVKQTQGKVIVYKGEPFPAYFSATCAGHTEDASNLWNIDIEPLKGVNCGFCGESLHYKWRAEIPLEKIMVSLNKSGWQITGKIKDISIRGRNRSGRIEGIKIYFDDKQAPISPKDFRNIIGPNIIRSNNFTVEVSGPYAYFEGFGWGHGVGLCQWGAYFMAKQGYKYKEIIRYYYPGAEISSIPYH